MQVLEHEHHRVVGALGAQPVLVRAAHLVAAQHGVLPGGAQLEALLLGERCADELPEELRHARAVGLGHAPRDARGELLPSRCQRLSVGDCRPRP